MSPRAQPNERISLRAKAMIVGASIGFVIAAISSTFSLTAARNYLLEQRENSAREQSFAHARLVANAINGGRDPFEALSSVRNTATSYQSLMFVNDEWISSGSGISSRNVPNDLIEKVVSGQAAMQRATYGGAVAVFTAYPVNIESGNQDEPSTLLYIGVSPLIELSNTLWSMSRALMIGIGISTLGGLAIGYWLARRVMGPLRDLSRTATEISSGNIEARVGAPAEPDLALIARSFNKMADDLQLRLEAESRFASQAAHELRSPLTAIKGAANLFMSRKDELPAGLLPTLKVLDERIIYFERLLQDLLLLGRQAAGIDSPNMTSRSPRQLFPAIASHLDIPESRVRFEGQFEDTEVLVDVSALIRVFENLNRNASTYAGGLEEITIIQDPSGVIVHVDDRGPGFSDVERESILRPFQRGRLAHGTEGAGLGLSIANGLLTSMGSTLVLGSNQFGGARCTFVLPHALGDHQ